MLSIMEVTKLSGASPLRGSIEDIVKLDTRDHSWTDFLARVKEWGTTHQKIGGLQSAVATALQHVFDERTQAMVREFSATFANACVAIQTHYTDVRSHITSFVASFADVLDALSHWQFGSCEWALQDGIP
jgi:hypothetical protein